MQHSFSIMIDDDNHFFTYGLKLQLQEFFQPLYPVIHFFGPGETPATVDVVFLSNNFFCPPWLYHLRQQQCYPYIFFIKDKEIGRDPFKQPVEGSAGTLYRHQSLDALQPLLKKTLLPQSTPFLPLRHECHNTTLLTSREEDVLLCLAQGKNGRGTALSLHISEKTVNTHKQNAMRKLNLSHNQDLFHWLLQGGTAYLTGSTAHPKKHAKISECKGTPPPNCQSTPAQEQYLWL